MSNKFAPSGKSNPCPVCGRGEPGNPKQGGDCRTLEQNNIVLCHTEQNNPGQLLNGYKWLRLSKDELWGVYVWSDRSSNGKVKGRKVQRTQAREEYLYPDRFGEPFVKVQRVPKGTEKDFFQYHWDGSEWVPGIPDSIRSNIPIYRYSEVREAISNGQPILMVEGEGVANALWEIGIPATTTIGGSKKYRSYGTGYKDDLEGATVILCPDRDKLGIAHMEDVGQDFPDAEWLKPYPKSLIWDHLPDVGGLDLEDWIQDGATIEDIFGAIVSQKEVQPISKEKPSVPTYEEALDHVSWLEEEFAEDAELEWQVRNYAYESGLAKRGLNGSSLLRLSRDRKDGAKALTVVTSKEILDRYKEGRQWLINGVVPLGTTMVLGAGGGTGKSSLSYDLVKHILLGKPWSGFKTRQGKCLIIQADEPEVDMADKLDIANFYDIPEVDIILEWRFSQVRQLEQLIKRNQYKFIIIDSYTACHAGMGAKLTESSAGDPIYRLRNIAQQYHCTFLILHHNNKMNELRDSSTIKDNPSEIWLMYPIKDNDQFTKNDFTLEITKSRSGLAGKYLLTRNPIDYSWRHGGALDGSDGAIHRVVVAINENPNEKFTPKTIADLLSIPIDRAWQDLEQARRFGLITAEWVVKYGETNSRYRLYQAVPKEVDMEAVEDEPIALEEPDPSLVMF
jgi:archaellum biogenesis ATPase FlaH